MTIRRVTAAWAGRILAIILLGAVIGAIFRGAELRWVAALKSDPAFRERSYQLYVTRVLHRSFAFYFGDFVIVGIAYFCLVEGIGWTLRRVGYSIGLTERP